MPSYPCLSPTCSEYVTVRGGTCPAHQGKATLDNSAHARKAFYDSAAWDRARRTKLADTPICERCSEAWGSHVHHLIPLQDCTPAERLAQSNLMSLCQPCHSAVEAEMRAG